MPGLKNISLKVKLIVLTSLLAAVVTVQGLLTLGGTPSRTVTVAFLVAGYLACVALFVFVLRRVTGGTKMVAERIDGITKAAANNVLHGMQALSEGDLTVELIAKTARTTEFDGDEFGGLMRHCEEYRDAMINCYGAYNSTVERLRDIVGHMASTASSVSAASEQMSSTSEESGKATGEIAQAITEVAEGAERQARMAEEAQRSAVEIARAVGESAESAEKTAEVASSAHEAATEGVAAADQANEAMKSVRESSESVTEAIRALADKSGQIGMIVQTITGIAEQTNLLALNAAIEAARAGDQGRGFAVVAEEVRKLAEDSQHAAKEISDLIAAMQDETSKAVAVVEDGARKTHDGAAVVEQTREAFLSIGNAVEDMNARIEQIAAASEEITASANSMQQSVGEVATVAEQSSASTQEVSASTEETSASAQQIAASAHELASNAELLAGLVAQFKVSG